MGIIKLKQKSLTYFQTVFYGHKSLSDMKESVLLRLFESSVVL